jgi:hypothetical protein
MRLLPSAVASKNILEYIIQSLLHAQPAPSVILELHTVASADDTMFPDLGIV